MRTYAEYLATQTVKTLNAAAKTMGLKGYSKLRKAELVAFIDDAIVNDCIAISADAMHFAQYGVWPVKVMAEVAPVTFSATPVAPAESAVETPESVQVQESDTSELVYAYRAMRATIRGMGNTPLRVKIVGRLRTLSAQLRAMGMVPAAL